MYNNLKLILLQIQSHTTLRYFRTNLKAIFNLEDVFRETRCAADITMAARNLLLISSSAVHGYEKKLETSKEEIQDLLDSKNVSTVLFIPYAQKNYDDYLNIYIPIYRDLGYKLEGIHQQDDPILAIEKSEAIFVGGGNTFLLLKTMLDFNLLKPIRKQVLDNGIPYIGVSAGTNVATCSIHTTNDMPIVHPASFDALDLVPFNINPHYIDVIPNTTSKSESRDDRINEYLELPHAKDVLGLREGSMLRVIGDKALLMGIKPAKLFKAGTKVTEEYPVSSDLSFLLNV